MAEKTEESWWQWIANTAQGLYATKLGADVAINQSKAQLAATKAEENQTISFLGMELHKETLLWIAGGSLLTVLLVVLLRRR